MCEPCVRQLRLRLPELEPALVLVLVLAWPLARPAAAAWSVARSSWSWMGESGREGEEAWWLRLRSADPPTCSRERRPDMLRRCDHREFARADADRGGAAALGPHTFCFIGGRLVNVTVTSPPRMLVVVLIMARNLAVARRRLRSLCSLFFCCSLCLPGTECNRRGASPFSAGACL